MQSYTKSRLRCYGSDPVYIHVYRSVCSWSVNTVNLNHFELARYTLNSSSVLIKIFKRVEHVYSRLVDR
jgi:hypothetical protein